MMHKYREGFGMVNELEKFGDGFRDLMEWEDIRMLPSSMQLVMERERTFKNSI